LVYIPFDIIKLHIYIIIIIYIYIFTCPQVSDTDMESLQDSVLQLVLSLLEDSMKREYFFQVSAFKIHSKNQRHTADE